MEIDPIISMFIDHPIQKGMKKEAHPGCRMCFLLDVGLLNGAWGGGIGEGEVFVVFDETVLLEVEVFLDDFKDGEAKMAVEVQVLFVVGLQGDHTVMDLRVGDGLV